LLHDFFLFSHCDNMLHIMLPMKSFIDTANENGKSNRVNHTTRNKYTAQHEVWGLINPQKNFWIFPYSLVFVSLYCTLTRAEQNYTTLCNLRESILCMGAAGGGGYSHFHPFNFRQCCSVVAMLLCYVCETQRPFMYKNYFF